MGAIAPCMLVACLVYFALAAVIYRWLFLYVYTPEFESAGAFWYDLFNCAMMGLIVGDASLAALAASYCGFTSHNFYACAVLPVFAFAFQAFCQRRYAIPSRHVSLEDAVNADVPEQDLSPFRNSQRSCDNVQFNSNYYVDPILTNRDSDSCASFSLSNL